jgi:hypothetical protein
MQKEGGENAYVYRSQESIMPRYRKYLLKRLDPFAAGLLDGPSKDDSATCLQPVTVFQGNIHHHIPSYIISREM